MPSIGPKLGIASAIPRVLRIDGIKDSCLGAIAKIDFVSGISFAPWDKSEFAFGIEDRTELPFGIIESSISLLGIDPDDNSDFDAKPKSDFGSGTDDSKLCGLGIDDKADFGLGINDNKLCGFGNDDKADFGSGINAIKLCGFGATANIVFISGANEIKLSGFGNNDEIELGFGIDGITFLEFDPEDKIELIFGAALEFEIKASKSLGSTDCGIEGIAFDKIEVGFGTMDSIVSVFGKEPDKTSAADGKADKRPLGPIAISLKISLLLFLLERASIIFLYSASKFLFIIFKSFSYSFNLSAKYSLISFSNLASLVSRFSTGVFFSISTLKFLQ